MKEPKQRRMTKVDQKKRSVAPLCCETRISPSVLCLGGGGREHVDDTCEGDARVGEALINEPKQLGVHEGGQRREGCEDNDERDDVGDRRVDDGDDSLERR